MGGVAVFCRESFHKVRRNGSVRHDREDGLEPDKKNERQLVGMRRLGRGNELPLENRGSAA